MGRFRNIIGGDGAVGGVSVGGADVAGLAVDLADVLRQIPAVGEPCAVFLNGEGAGGLWAGSGPR